MPFKSSMCLIPMLYKSVAIDFPTPGIIVNAFIICVAVIYSFMLSFHKFPKWIKATSNKYPSKSLLEITTTAPINFLYGFYDCRTKFLQLFLKFRPLTFSDFVRNVKSRKCCRLICQCCVDSKFIGLECNAKITHPSQIKLSCPYFFRFFPNKSVFVKV